MLPIDLSEAGCPANYFKKACCMYIFVYRNALKTSHDHVILRLKYVLSKLVTLYMRLNVNGFIFLYKKRKQKLEDKKFNVSARIVLHQKH